MEEIRLIIALQKNILILGYIQLLENFKRIIKEKNNLTFLVRKLMTILIRRNYILSDVRYSVSILNINSFALDLHAASGSRYCYSTEH